MGLRGEGRCMDSPTGYGTLSMAGPEGLPFFDTGSIPGAGWWGRGRGMGLGCGGPRWEWERRTMADVGGRG